VHDVGARALPPGLARERLVLPGGPHAAIDVGRAVLEERPDPIAVGLRAALDRDAARRLAQPEARANPLTPTAQSEAPPHRASMAYPMGAADRGPPTGEGLRGMRALALADRPFHADPGALVAQHDLDLVLTLGDLQPSWVETLDRVRVPKLGVRGNHDAEPYMEHFGIEDLHMRRVELDSGLSLCGFEGCVAYRRGRGSSGPAYTQREAAKLIRKLPPADVVLCHCPPYGVNDDPDDPAHVGFIALRDWVLDHRPRLLLHGHTHPNPGTLVERLGDTRVVYVNGARVVELEAAQIARPPGRTRP
jgi:Icc-related predicted phosphoesterase